MNTLVQTIKTNVQAARDRLRDHQEKSEILSREIRVSQICESAVLMRKVSIGQCCRTIRDVTDGFGGKTGSCREYTLTRDHQDSEPIGWICGHTRIGPVRQVRVLCCFDQYGIEIRYRRHQKTHLTLGLSYPEAQTDTWMNRGTTKTTLSKPMRW